MHGAVLKDAPDISPVERRISAPDHFGWGKMVTQKSVESHKSK